MENKRFYPKNAVRLCLDNCQLDCFEGNIYSYMNDTGIQFHCFTMFVMIVEELLDYIGTPQAFQQTRTFNKKKRYLKLEELNEHEDCSYIYQKKGSQLTYDIVILTRKKSDWQGLIKSEEGEILGRFNNILELMYLLEELAGFKDK